MKAEWLSTRDILDIIKVSYSTLNTYLGSIWLCKYRKVNRFYICQKSLNILYSYMLKKGRSNERISQAAKRLKKYYPEAEEIELEFPN